MSEIINESPKKETVILFQGDSITDGKRLRGKENEWDLNHQMGHGYAFVVNALLGSRYPERNLKFINRGISGNRVADLYGRWKEDTLNLHPDVLSILIGINDCGSTIYENAGSDPDRFEKIYQLLIDEAKEQNPDLLLVLCEPFLLPVGERKEHFKKWNDLMKPLQEKTRLLAERNKTIFVPLQDKFNQLCEIREPDYWVWDGVHPTVCGHQILANEWMKAVCPRLGLNL